MDGKGVKESKPRRLEEQNDETVSYLKSLDEQLSKEGLDSSDFEILVDNVMTEIKSRAASAASDRRTNDIMEKLILVSNVSQLLQFMQLFAPYSVFLARNRFSSHLLQSLLSRLVKLLKAGDFGSSDIDEEAIAAASCNLLSPLLIGTESQDSNFNWLSKDTCASHVLRSSLCFLVGLPCIAEKKSKASKHLHSVAYAEPLESLLKKGSFEFDKDCAFPMPPACQELLKETVNQLIAWSDEMMLSVLTDNSSCVVIGLLLRIFHSRDLIESDSNLELANQLCRHILRQQEHSTEEASAAVTSSTSVFYQMAGDRAASYVLEVIIECCDQKYFLELVKENIVEHLHEYIHDESGNFIVQAIFRRIATIFVLSYSKGTAKVLETVVNELIASPNSNSIFQRRGGIIFWVCEAASSCVASAVAPSDEKKETKSSKTNPISLVFTLCNWVCNGLRNMNRSAADSDSNSSKDPATLVEILTVKLSSVVPSKEKDNAASNSNKEMKDSTQLLFARITGALIKIASCLISQNNGSGSSQASEEYVKLGNEIIDSFLNLPVHILVSLASTGLTSRSTFDVFFSSSICAMYCDQLVRSFAQFDTTSTSSDVQVSGIVRIASHHCGQHILKQLFNNAVDTTTKEMIVQFLVAALRNSSSPITRSKEFKNTLALVHSELYERQPEEWRLQIKKHSQAKSLLNELEFGLDMFATSSSSSSSSFSTAVTKKYQEPTKPQVYHKQPYQQYQAKTIEKQDVNEGEDEEGGEANANSTGRKRIRKRKSKNTTATDTANEIETETHEIAPEKVKVSEVRQTEKKIVQQNTFKSESTERAPKRDSFGDSSHQNHYQDRAGFGSRSSFQHSSDSRKRNSDSFRNQSNSSSYSKFHSSSSHSSSNRVDHEKIEMLKSGKLLSSSFIKAEIASLENAKKKSRS